jgi:putative glutamine amidotransferase
VSGSLEQIAWAEDGVLEAVVAPANTWVLGVQWHPEAMADTDEHQRGLFEEFLDAATAYDQLAYAQRGIPRRHARSA